MLFAEIRVSRARASLEEPTVSKKILFAGLIMAGSLAACQSRDPVSVADYCADPAKAWDNVCQLNVEINGTKTALANTDLKLSEARAIANSALSAASRAQATADSAQRSAASAQTTANEARSLALSSLDDLHCETLTINKTDTGSCPADFRLMSCNQTRYTHRAGGLSFLREINDQTCRFNSRVLEMKVRCCTVAQERPRVTYTQPRPSTSRPSTPVARPVTSSSPTVRFTPLQGSGS